MMEELKGTDETISSPPRLPSLIQYGVKLPFRVAVVRKTDSGKTHSIIKCWLGGKISCWKYNGSELKSCHLKHCL